jgi:hypothetical protein
LFLVCVLLWFGGEKLVEGVFVHSLVLNQSLTMYPILGLSSKSLCLLLLSSWDDSYHVLPHLVSNYL